MNCFSLNQIFNNQGYINFLVLPESWLRLSYLIDHFMMCLDKHDVLCDKHAVGLVVVVIAL